jgi:hydroxyacylglutathione hydrolase
LGFGGYRSLVASPEARDPGRMHAIGLLSLSLPPAAPGSFPDQWINGVDCGSEPKMQVHAYNDDFYILRQSKCEIYEAPFLYLIFGEDKALLMDTGSNNNTPIWRTVDGVIQRWLRKNGKTSIPLLVAHTHTHADHNAGDPQFVGVPYVEIVVGKPLPEVVQFWGFANYPLDQPTIDLGNRVIDVLGTPGHQSASVTLYDRETHLLLTGDLVYPGHLFVFVESEWPTFVASIQRLVDFAATHPVEWVLGCHIEMSKTPGGSFAWGTTAHPNEHELQLRPAILGQILRAAKAMGSNPQCKIFDEFVIHPVFKCGSTWNG